MIPAAIRILTVSDLYVADSNSDKYYGLCRDTPHEQIRNKPTALPLRFYQNKKAAEFTIEVLNSEQKRIDATVMYKVYRFANPVSGHYRDCASLCTDDPPLSEECYKELDIRRLNDGTYKVSIKMMHRLKDYSPNEFVIQFYVQSHPEIKTYSYPIEVQSKLQASDKNFIRNVSVYGDCCIYN